MNDDPPGQSPRDEKILEQFRHELDHSSPKDGLERVRFATQRDLARLQPRSRGRLRNTFRFGPIWAWSLVAALLGLGAGTGSLLQPAANPLAVPIACPHDGQNPELNWRRIPAAVQRDFNAAPDRFPRICHCSPRYSGNLRLRKLSF